MRLIFQLVRVSESHCGILCLCVIGRDGNYPLSNALMTSHVSVYMFPDGVGSSPPDRAEEFPDHGLG